jgi:hypothetical protein
MENVHIVSGILSTELNVPLLYVVVYIFLITVAALFGRSKFVLLISYVFAFYIGYFHNHFLIRETLKGFPGYVGLYFGSGVIILVLAIVSFFSER